MFCKCGCGKEIIQGGFVHGHGRRVHGESVKRTPEYTAWTHIVERCSDPNSNQWKRYGARGITVCEKWRANYQAFLNDVGRRPTPKHSIDRYPNNNGNYEPGNVRWATRLQQAANTRQNRYVEISGISLCISEWARRLGLTRSQLQRREKTAIKHGQSTIEVIQGLLVP